MSKKYYLDNININLKDWWEKLRNLIIKKPKELTTQELVNRLVSEFECHLMRDSISHTILFPMSFGIILHDDDYNRISPFFQPIAGELVEGFNNVINKHKTMKGKSDRKVLPMGKNWNFELSHTSASTIEGMEIGVNNPLFVISAVANVINNNTRSENNVSMTISCHNSKPNDYKDINPEVMKGLNIITDDHIMVPFYNNSKINEAKEDDSDDCYGTLSYADGPKTFVFSIKNDIVSISGLNDTRQQNNIFKLNATDIENDHVQIKYDKDEKKFFVSTYVEGTRLNNRLLKVSTGEPVWTELYNNSEILIKSVYSVRFKKKDSK